MAAYPTPSVAIPRHLGLFLGVKPYAGGMFQYAQSLLAACAAIPEYRMTVVYAAEEWAPLLVDIPVHAVPLRFHRLGRLMSDGLLALRVGVPLTRVLARLNPVVAQLRAYGCDAWIFPAQESIAYQAGVPMIASVHDLMHRTESHFPEVSRVGVREHRFRALTRTARAVLVDSQVGKTQVVEAYGTPPQKVYPLPYLPPRSILDAHPREDFDAHYRLPSRFFFYPAQFWAHKNHLRLVDAAAQLRARIPNIHLVFTGGPRYAYSQVRKHVECSGMEGHVTFSGYVPDADLPGFYRRARALVMPTFFGPTNIPPLEAMACGCPVAVSDIYGMREQSGDAALYFNPSSTAQMAEVMARLWEDDTLCAQLRARGEAKMAAWGQVQFTARLREILEQAMA